MHRCNSQKRTRLAPRGANHDDRYAGVPDKACFFFAHRRFCPLNSALDSIVRVLLSSKLQV